MTLNENCHFALSSESRWRNPYYRIAGKGFVQSGMNADMIILCGNSVSESDFAQVPVIENDCLLYDEVR